MQHDWTSQFPDLEHLKECPQDPFWHAEGDVWTHTRMVLDAMSGSDWYRSASEGDRQVALTAAALHDIGKPDTTRTEADGRITSKKHSVVGRDLTFRYLVEHGCTDMRFIHHVASLVRFHQWPYYLSSKPNPSRDATIASQVVRCDILEALATSDWRGRISAEAESEKDSADRNFSIDFFRAQCEENGCWTSPVPFPNLHARFTHANDPGADNFYRAHDDRQFKTVIMCGLPGAGKSTWVSKSGISDIVSLDMLREEMGVDPSKRADQSIVVSAAMEEARVLLRRKVPFIWDAVNLRRDFRSSVVKAMVDYGAEVKIVCLFEKLETLLARNASRSRVVPENVIRKNWNSFQVPEARECHRLVFVCDGQEYDITENPYDRI